MSNSFSVDKNKVRNFTNIKSSLMRVKFANGGLKTCQDLGCPCNAVNPRVPSSQWRQVLNLHDLCAALAHCLMQ